MSEIDINFHLREISHRIDILEKKIDQMRGFFESFPVYRGFCGNCGGLKEAKSYMGGRWLCEICTELKLKGRIT